MTASSCAALRTSLSGMVTLPAMQGMQKTAGAPCRKSAAILSLDFCMNLGHNHGGARSVPRRISQETATSKRRMYSDLPGLRNGMPDPGATTPSQAGRRGAVERLGGRMLSPEQLSVTKAMGRLLRAQHGAGFCATCPIKHVGAVPCGHCNMRDERLTLFASPGQFVVTAVCVSCGEGVKTTATMAARRTR
jgi:hypothetical protein